QMSVELDKLGSSINFSASLDGVNVVVRTLAKNAGKTMKLLEDKLLNPVFDQETFERNKKRALKNLSNAKVRPTYVASTVFDKVMYTDKNILGWASSGTTETIENIQLADVENYYKNYFSKNEAKVV